MYDPTTPTVALCVQLAAAVREAAGSELTAPSGVDWDFFRRYGDGTDGLTELLGRQVVFFPTRYEWAGENRAEDAYAHAVSCLVVERYADPGDPPKEWTAARVDWVHDRIVKGLRFTRTGPPAWNLKLVTLNGSVEVLDVAKLATGGKLFYSLVQLEFLELVTP